jgi:hypothetical protein
MRKHTQIHRLFPVIGVLLAGILVSACRAPACECGIDHWAFPDGRSVPAPVCIDCAVVNPYLTPLPPANGAYHLTDDSGNLPCGLADVPNFGLRIFDLETFDACQTFAPDLTVYCLNGEGQWIGDNVSDVAISLEEHSVSFTVAQLGTCGMFPADQQSAP